MTDPALTVMTKLDAVNLCLRAIGDVSVTWADAYVGPSTNHNDNEDMCIECVDNALRELNSRTEWKFNTYGDFLREVPYIITADASGYIVLPTNTTRAILHKKDSRYGTIDVCEKMDSADGNRLKLFNMNGTTTVPGDGTFVWTVGATVQLQLTVMETFMRLPQPARMWVAYTARMEAMARKHYDNTPLYTYYSTKLMQIERQIENDNSVRHTRNMLDSAFMWQATRRWQGPMKSE